MKKRRWQISIDTGGTFTDCYALDPEQRPSRLKLLSSGCLRGSILRKVDASTIEVSLSSPYKEDIYEGYTLRCLGSEGSPLFIASTTLAEGLITLDSTTALPFDEGDTFEITAHEEVPVFAARILTKTPLKGQFPLLDLRLGSTKGTNALLERKGAKTLFLVTKGFADLIPIGHQQRPDLFQLDITKPAPLYTEVIEVNERIDAQGQVLTVLSEEELSRIADRVNSSATESIAIAFVHSYRNPSHELLVAERLRGLGIRHVSCSSGIAPSIKLLPRALTAITNAYLSPIISDYLENIRQQLGNRHFQVINSAGSILSVNTFLPKDSLLSGPAGGLVGAVKSAKLSGVRKLLTLDMGGTSTDVAHYNGSYDYQYLSKVGDVEIVSPTLAIETIAAGGGSICDFDGHRFIVGPESAGASPGPACYGNSGPLTLTDVNLLLGRLDPGHFGIPLSIAEAKAALDSLIFKIAAKSKNIDKETVLLSLLQIGNEKMAEAIKKISVRQGYAPKDYHLMAFGGAGGQHICAVASLLGIQRGIVPYDAGLLSAYGIQDARAECFEEKQVLALYDTVEGEIALWVDTLVKRASKKLQQEGHDIDAIHISHAFLYLRFQGQDTALEIDYLQHSSQVKTVFQEKYTALYGHWLEDVPVLELESLKVICAALPRENLESRSSEEVLKTYSPLPKKQLSNPVSEQFSKAIGLSVFVWEELSKGAFLKGPGILVSNNGTLYIEEGWQVHIDAHNHALLEKQKDTLISLEQEENPEAAQLELFKNRFSAVAEEMGALLQRVSFSVNIKERLDFSCALLDKKGQLIVNAPHIPVHLGSLGICVRKVRQSLPIEEGDVVLTNHPGYGGSHLPDVTLIAAVFDEGEHIGYVANRAHHAEIGGKSPGSMPADATSLEEEGVVLAPLYLMRKGVPRWEQVQGLLTHGTYPSRNIAENIADLRGALAALLSGVKSLKQLCRTYGQGKVLHYMKALEQYAAKVLEDKLSTLGPQHFYAKEVLDDGSALCVAISTNDNGMQVDFTGSASTHPCNLNATSAIVQSVVLYVLRLWVNQDIPLNEGLMRPVQLLLPEGMLNPNFANPERLPAVVGGNTEVSQRLTDTMLKALGLVACSQGTMNNLLFGNDSFGYYETIGGGVGAGPGFHGQDAVHQHMTNTRITDTEIMELRYPVRIDRFSIRTGSGGTGEWNGGEGIHRQLTFLEPVRITLLAQHRKIAPYGLEGGGPGKVGQQWILKENGEKEFLPGGISQDVRAGERLIILTPGGGGYGKKS